MPKENRRTRMTRYLLNDSFWRLLTQKPLGKITVKEICQAADVNRSTYYQYYADPFDQARRQEEELIGEMLACADCDSLRMGEVLPYDRLYPVVKDTLDCICANRARFRVLLGDHCGFNLQVDMIAAYLQKLRPEKDTCSPEWENCLREFIFLSSGSFAVIYHWLLAGSTTSTAEAAEWITGFVKAGHAGPGPQVFPG